MSSTPYEKVSSLRIVPRDVTEGTVPLHVSCGCNDGYESNYAFSVPELALDDIVRQWQGHMVATRTIRGRIQALLRNKTLWYTGLVTAGATTALWALGTFLLP